MSQGGHGYPLEVVVEEEPPEVVVEEDPLGSDGGRGPPGSDGGRGPLPGSGSGRGPLPPQGKDKTRPAEKYCWASGQYALDKSLSCCICVNVWCHKIVMLCTCNICLYLILMKVVTNIIWRSTCGCQSSPVYCKEYMQYFLLDRNRVCMT